MLRSLGLELRAPFPKGYVLEEGDWALLDPVKARRWPDAGSLMQVGQGCAGASLLHTRFPATI